MRIYELVGEAHANAVNKGWWDVKRSYGEIIALIHSEVSEALEDYRAGKNPAESWYEYKYEDVGSVFEELTVLEYSNGIVKAAESSVTDGYNILGKPCGIPSELADICIRIFDLAGKYDWGARLEEKISTLNPPYEHRYEFAEELTGIHHDLSQSWIFHNKHQKQYVITSLAYAVLSVMQMCRKYRIDLEQAIAEKMIYNSTRQHRHGGKVL